MLIRPGIRFPRKRFAQPLGLLYLVSVLRQNFPGQFEIDLVEQALYKLDFKQIKERIKKFNPDLVGFSCLSQEADEMAKISHIVKELKPECLTVLGGPHASVFYDCVLEKNNIDIVVIGEGERTFPELLKKLLSGEPIEQVRGIAFKRKDRIILTPPQKPIEDLDSLPFPAWDLIDFQDYSWMISTNAYCHSVPWAVIFTSRGCPYQCAYCHNIFGKRTRFRSPENVISEIELLVNKYGVKEIHIVDDVFNLDILRAKKICDLIIERKIKIKIAFPNGLRGDIMDKELIGKLKQAGCYAIGYAVETASPRLQKLINKNLDFDKIRQVISWTADEKIITQGYFMLGFPGETREEMEMTINYALKSRFLIAFFSLVAVYPRTHLMEIAKKAYPDFDFDKWNDKLDMANFHYFTEEPFYKKATGLDSFKIQHSAHRRFYFRPRQIFLILLRFPKNFFLIRGIWWVLRNSFISLYKFEKSVFYSHKMKHET